MPRSAHQLLTMIASLSALVLLSSGELRPAGVRTAFESLAGGSKGRALVVDVVVMSE